MGRRILLLNPPRRIISVVPSQTELLYHLGLDEEVIGITKFCEHPLHWHKTKTKIGGTKKLSLGLIEELNPDLIIGNKEENTKEEIEYLQSKFPVWMSDITSLEDSLTMIRSVGMLTGRASQGESIAKRIEQAFQNVERKKESVLYLIWRRPWMGAGAETFVDTMLSKIGLTNVLENTPRYPVLSDEDIAHLDPEHVFLSSEPFPFREKHVAELKLLLPKSKITLVDGQFFSWYGSRLMYAPEYFNSLTLD